MQHPHVRVYSNDHADDADLMHDYRCQDLDEAKRHLVELVREYADRVGAEEAMGDVVELEQRDAVTLWPQDQALKPVHITIHFCAQQHALEG